MEKQYSFIELLSLHFRTYQGQYVKRIWSKCGNFHSAEEIVQDAYVKAMVYPSEQDMDLDAFNHWFFRVAVNAMHDYYRKEDIRKRADLVSFQDDLLRVLNVEDTAIREVILNREINTLGSLDEQIIHDRIKLGMAFKDIAERYNVSVGKTKMLVFRFQKDLESRYGANLRGRPRG